MLQQVCHRAEGDDTHCLKPMCRTNEVGNYSHSASSAIATKLISFAVYQLVFAGWAYGICAYVYMLFNGAVNCVQMRCGGEINKYPTCIQLWRNLITVIVWNNTAIRKLAEIA